MDIAVRTRSWTVVVACGLLVMTGCAGTPVEPEGVAATSDDATEPEPAADETTQPTDRAAGELGRYLGPDDLSFTTEADLSPEVWTIEWLWSFNPEEFEAEQEMDGSLTTLTDLRTGCEFVLISATIDVEPVDDDRVPTDEILVQFSSGALSAEDVAMYAYDDQFPRPGDGEPSSDPGVGDHTVPMRSISAQANDGRDFTYSARAFGAAGKALWVGTICPPGTSSQAELRRLKDSQLVVMVSPANQ